MEVWHPPIAAKTYERIWQKIADEAAFKGGFTRAYGAGRKYAQLDAIVLTEQEDRMLRTASEALGAILARVTEWVQRSPVLLPVLGIPEALAPWVTLNPGTGLFSLFARFDWVQDVDGRWWCLECNADTPGGLPEATAWQSRAHAAVADGLVDPNVHLLERLGRALRSHLPGRAGFITSPGRLEDWENAMAAAAARGMDSVIGGLPTVEDGVVSINGTSVDSIYRFYPGDWLGRHRELLAVLEQGFPCVNPGHSLIAQSKALFALLWHLVGSRQVLTPVERDWVERFIPFTSLEPMEGPWVAKPYWEREGAGVQIRAGKSRLPGDVVYQSRVTIAPRQWQVGVGGQRKMVGVRPVVGVYAVAGQAAGYMTRVGGTVTDRSAHVAPTYVRVVNDP